MKKLLFVVVLILGINITKAQEDKVSIIAGYTNVNLKLKVSVPEYDESDSDSAEGDGFFIGITREIKINDKNSFKPGVIYTRVTNDDSGDEEKLEYIQIPFYFNHYPNEKIFLSAGPKVDYVLEDDVEDGYQKISLALGFGIGFELSKQLDVIANYSFQLTDSLSSEFDEDMSSALGTDVNTSFKQNFFNIGLAYNF